MLEYLAMAPFRRALIALAATGVAFPCLGTYILALDLISARFAVMHASLLGAAIGLCLGISPLVSAIIASAVAGFGIARLSEHGTSTASGSLGLIMTISIGLAFILFYKADINAIEAFNLFWGSILALSPIDIALTVAGASTVLIGTFVFFPSIRAVLYDRELAAAQGLPATAIYRTLITIVCVGIGLAMKVSGALMIDAVTLLPALAAKSMRRSFRETLIWGSIYGLIMNFGGFALAFALDLPTSPAIIVLGGIIVLAGRWFERRNGGNRRRA